MPFLREPTIVIPMPPPSDPLARGKASVFRTALRTLFKGSSHPSKSLAASAARLTRERKRQEYLASKADAAGSPDFNPLGYDKTQDPISDE